MTLTENHLWGEVFGSSAESISNVISILLYLAESKISQSKVSVLIYQDVFRLQITMHNVIGVAIVDARENLFHEARGIILSELASGYDFIEQFTTFANVSNNVVPLVVLKEFVHLKDVRVIEVLQVVDLVVGEDHRLYDATGWID